MYEFSYNGKVFYVGIGSSSRRATHRWAYVKNLLRHQDADTLKPAKEAGLKGPNNSVITALIRAGLPEHTVTFPWRGHGRKHAVREKTKRINQRLAEGCLLTNVVGNPNKASVEEILTYLGVGTAG